MQDSVGIKFSHEQFFLAQAQVMFPLIRMGGESRRNTI